MKKTIMVVDDEADIRDTIKTVLKKEGYNIVIAVNADDCLKKLPQQKVDLILIDIMMPGTPVREAIKQIKGVKVAFLSIVRISEAEREELLKSKNVVDYIQKPFDIDGLVARVKKILK